MFTQQLSDRVCRLENPQVWIGYGVEVLLIEEVAAVTNDEVEAWFKFPP